MIRCAALYLLARRDHAKLELIRKLKQKKFAEADILETLDALIADGLLNELRFLENFILYRRKKGYGPLYIKAALRERGIAEDLIEEALKITDNAWLTEMKQVWQKRFRNRMPSDFKTKAKQMRFLQYRGFTHEQIDSLFSSHHDDSPHS